MKVAFRFDCTPGLGTGHAHRMANLAEELDCLAAEIIYITSAMTKQQDLPSRIDIFSVESNHVSQPNDWDLTIDAQSLGDVGKRFEELDAYSTLKICNQKKIDVLILDHYFLSQKWVDLVNKNGLLVIAVDDIGRTWNNLFALIDYNPIIKIKYQSIAGIKHKLFGLNYALLSREYRDTQRTPQENGESIQVFTGGTDQTGLTTRLMNVIRPILDPMDRILLVIGNQNNDSLILHEQWGDDDQVEIYTSLTTLSGINAISTWAIGAGGVAAIERCCVGVPSLVVSISKNQELISKDLDALGVIKYIGNHDQLLEANLTLAIENFKADKNLRENIATAAQESVDSFGVQRVLIKLFPDLQEMKLRSAENDDSNKLYSWVNDSLVRKNSIHRIPITKSEHQTWFQNYLNNSSSQIYILEIKGLLLGQVRFDLIDNLFHISYSIDSKFRGLGLGKRIIEMGLKEIKTDKLSKYVAEVRDFNTASRRIFESIGFTLVGVNEDQVVKYHFQDKCN